jgi:hypothetical protein
LEFGLFLTKRHIALRIHYVWTVGFVQSAMTHFSSHVLSELTLLLQKGLLVLALDQPVSSFFVALSTTRPDGFGRRTCRMDGW